MEARPSSGQLRPREALPTSSGRRQPQRRVDGKPLRRIERKEALSSLGASSSNGPSPHTALGRRGMGVLNCDLARQGASGPTDFL